MSGFKVSIKRYPIALTISLFCLSFNSSAQQFDPFEGRAADFHVAFGRYFKSDSAEKTARLRVLDSAATFKRDTSWTLADLHLHLDRYEKLLVALKRHAAYFNLRYYVNNKDTLARQSYSQLNDTIGSLRRMVGGILQKPIFRNMSDAGLSHYHLTKYRYLITQATGEAAHHLPAGEAAVADKLGDALITHLADRYDHLMDQIKAGNRAAILKNPDSLSRRTGMDAYYKAYNDHGEVLAATLIDIALQNTALAKLTGFKSAPEIAYERSLQLPEASVKQVFSAVNDHAGILQDYQRLQASRVKRATGLRQVHSWDTSLPVGFTAAPMRYGEARSLILAALSPLGPEYGRSFARLLDPANGELDIAGGPDRVTEFTSVGFPGVPESLYMKSFSGSQKEVSRLAHEGGHAIHEQFMSDHLAVPFYQNGPGFLFEAYAMLNELLLMDELEKREQTPQGKAYYTKMFLDKLSLELFTSAAEGAFEQGVYDGVSAGSITTREDIDRLYAGVITPYDIYFAGEPQRSSEWINKRLLFDDPIYNVNYLYAILVSCKLYTQVHEDPKGFAVKYTALLKNGFDAPAGDLLKKFMGFGLDNEALLNGAVQLMKERSSVLGKLYDQF